MLRTLLCWMVLGGATLPLVYYFAAICIARRFFRRPSVSSDSNFRPPLSVLKPVQGLDHEAYDNFASFCTQDYPEYEILFCVSQATDPAIPVIEKLIRDFPERSIRLLIGFSPAGANNKVSKLCRLAEEARYEIFVISDSDVRVRSDYLRTVVSPFRDSQVGAVTCLYSALGEATLADEIEGVGLTSDFLPSVLVARQLEGVKFALGATMATTRRMLADIAGFEAIADCLSDDFELGCRVAKLGYRVELLPYAVSTVLHARTLSGLWRQHSRWSVGVRHARPWGYLGLLFTQGLPWALAAAAVSGSVGIASGWLAAYLVLRLTMAWAVAVRGLKDSLVRRKWWLIPLWDALNFLIWSASFFRNRIWWRGEEFYVRRGRLIPISPELPNR